MSKFRRKRKYQEVEPDEILIDAQNLPGFDSTRLEGRIEKPIEKKAFKAVLYGALVIGIIFSFQLLKLQVIDATSLKQRADANHLQERIIISERGLITDRNDKPLALNEWREDLGFAVRKYPLGEAASHFIGYVSYPKRDQNGYWFQDTIEGLSGLEASYDNMLRGQNGVEIKETSAIGETISGSIVRNPKGGEELALSIDADLQKVMYEAIKTRSEESGFVGGSGVVMDVNTGEIHALVSYPSYDPEVVSLGTSQEAIEGYVTNERSPFLDRAVSGLYTPGSVVKPFVALAALEEGVISPEEEILSTGSISIPNPYDPSKSTIFKDWKAHGWVDMREAIAVSSDVYFYAIGGGFEDQGGLGISLIESYMRSFGFGDTTEIELGSEESGVIPNPEWKANTFNGERWFLGNTYHTAIGQYGFQVTAIQLARATAAIANGGYLVKPTFVKGDKGEKNNLHLNPEHLGVIQEGMHQAVEEGTAQALNIPEFSVAGKTGTAEVGAQKEYINSVLVGFYPYENPRYSFTIVMERADAGTLSGAPAAMRPVLEWVRDNRFSSEN